MKQQVESLRAAVIASDEEPEPDSSESRDFQTTQVKREMAEVMNEDDDEDMKEVDEEVLEEEEEGPIDLSKPTILERNCRAPLNFSSRTERNPMTRPDADSPPSADSIMEAWQRTLLTAGMNPYFPPFMFLRGSDPEDLAKATTRLNSKSNQLPFPFGLIPSQEMLEQAPIVCDPYGMRHLVVRSGDGNLITLPLSGTTPKQQETLAKDQPSYGRSPPPFRKFPNQDFQDHSSQHRDDYHSRRDQSEDPRYGYESRTSLALGLSNKSKSELVSRLESAPVATRYDNGKKEDRRPHHHHQNGREHDDRYSRIKENGDSKRRYQDTISESPERRRESRYGSNHEPRDFSRNQSVIENSSEEEHKKRKEIRTFWERRSAAERPEMEDEGSEDSRNPLNFRSRSCSDLARLRGDPTDARKHFNPVSLSCPSLSSAAPASSHQQSESYHQENNILHRRKRKLLAVAENDYYRPRDDPQMTPEGHRHSSMLEEDDSSSELMRSEEIVNAPITRLFNPKRSVHGYRSKVPRLVKLDDGVGVGDMLHRKIGYIMDNLDQYRHRVGEEDLEPHHRHHRVRDEDLEDHNHRDAFLMTEAEEELRRRHLLTTDAEETFLERLKHSAPLGVPWNAYSYYTQMMQNLTEHQREALLRDSQRRHEASDLVVDASPPPRRNHHHFDSSGSPSPATTPVPISPPGSLVSSSTVTSTGANGMTVGVQDSRKMARVLTGKHVRQGTGASPSTLMTLRQKIQERQRAKELPYQLGFVDHHRGTLVKISREVKKRQQVRATSGVANKGR